MKIATQQYELETDPDNVNREVSQQEIRTAYELFSNNFHIKPVCLRSKTCLYTTTEDFGFVIDYHPQSDNIIIASPCSGHGFKHSAGIGKLLTQMVTDGKLMVDLSPFRLDRF